MKILQRNVIHILFLPLMAFLVSCGEKEENINNEVKKDSTEVNKTPDTISASEMKILMEEPGVIVLDIRTSDEYEKKNLDKTLNLDYNSGQFEENISFLDKEMTYLVLSNSDEKSGNAVIKLRSKGYKTILIKNGIEVLK